MGIFSKKNKEEKQSPQEEAEVKDEAKKDNKDDSKQSMKDFYNGSRKQVTKPSKEISKNKKEKVFGNAHKVLIRPLITEKATNLGAFNQYVFAVAVDSNKIEIAKAIDEVYGIKPINVNIIRVSGKIVRYGRIIGKRKNWKKAIITLPEGKTINIYEGV